MTTKNILHKAWARAVAFVLAVIMIAMTVLCIIGAYFSYDRNLYFGEEPSFADTGLCISEMNELLDYFISSSLYSAVVNELPISNTDLNPDESVHLVIKDQNGSVLYGTLPKNSSLVISDYGVEIEVRSGESINNDIINYGFGPEYDTYDEIYDPESEAESDAEADSDSSFVAPSRKILFIDAFISNVVDRSSSFFTAYLLFDTVCSMRYNFIYIGALSLLLSIVLIIFLCSSAGRIESDEKGRYLIRQDKIPLDIYIILDAAICVLVYWFFCESVYTNDLFIEIAGGALSAIVWIALALGLIMTVAARLKVGGWRRNFLLCRVFSFLGKAAVKLFHAVPIAWRTIVVFLVFMTINFIAFTSFMYYGNFLTFMFLFIFDLCAFACVISAALQLKSLQKGGRAIAAGDLSYTVDTSRMFFDLKEHGENLNSISSGISKAVEDRLRSERFKTELITNVSHDLKTPLTSIVSYVDLLKNEDIQNESAREYIDVLDRQSSRLKKLTEDLIEASKASSGAISVNKTTLNVSEMLHQTTAEFSERFARAGITPIENCPDEDLMIYSDGRLIWRIFDNLMQNICKYALSGTRAYFDVFSDSTDVIISVKNVSAEPLNIPAEELMERFVRGDRSRSTDGSGLGLSIAQSLTELLGGTMNLVLDGDLFKVVLTFPLSE